MDFHSRRPHRRVVLCSTSHSPPPTDPQIPSERLLQFSQLTAGAVSGIANVVILSPLEVVKVRMQAQARGTAATAMPRYDGLGHALRVMLRDEGWRSYYRGMNASLWAFVPNWAVFWYSYEGLKRRLGPQHNGQGIVRNPTANHVASAFGAGAITAVATAPMWTLKSRLQTVRICLKFDLLDLRRAHPRHLCYRIFSDVALLLSTMFGLAFKDLAVGGRMRYSSVWGGLRKIVKDEGFRAMYKGLSPTMLGLGHVMLQFPIYEAVRSKMCQGREEDLKPVHVLVASSVSKVVASAAFYHHEVVRTTMQIDMRNHRYASEPARMASIYRDIVREKGFRGLYRGFQVNLIRSVPNCIIAFSAYEYAKRVVLTQFAEREAAHAEEENSKREIGRGNAR